MSTLTKAVHAVILVDVSGNSFGDQIIRLLVDGQIETVTNSEGDHRDPKRVVRERYRELVENERGAT